MAIKLVDELKAMGNFPIAHAEGINLVKEDGTEDNLQNPFDNGELGGGGDSSVTLTQAEYEALTEEEKLDGLYYTYDTKRIYKNGVQYGASEPIPLTMEEYKTLKEAGAIDEQQEYLVSADAEGIFLGAEDIGYNNTESSIQATTVQGAIDKVNDKVDGLIDDEVSDSTVWSSKKTSDEIAKKESVYITDSIANTLYYACEYFGLDCRNQYQVLEIEVIDAKGQNLKFNSIYKHEVLHHAQVISENGITLKAIDTVGTLAFENASDYTIKVKHIDICPDSIGDTLVTVINRANKNALVSEIGRTQVPHVGTSTGWKAEKNLSSLPIGTYRLTSMHSSSGSVIDALILKTSYSYFLKTILKEGANITVGISGDTLTVAENTTSIGVISVFLNTVGINA